MCEDRCVSHIYDLFGLKNTHIMEVFSLEEDGYKEIIFIMQNHIKM